MPPDSHVDGRMKKGVQIGVLHQGTTFTFDKRGEPAHFAEHVRSYFRRFSEIRTEHMRGWGSRERGFAPRDRR